MHRQGPATFRASTVAPRNYKPQWTAEDFSRVGPHGVNDAWSWLYLDDSRGTRDITTIRQVRDQG